MITREIDYKTQIGAVEGTIKITIFSPEQNSSEHEDWQCRFRIELPNQTIDQKLFGIDSLQALLLVLKTIKSLLHNYIESNKLTVSWLGLDTIGLDLIN